MQKKIIIGVALLLGIVAMIFSYNMINKQVEEATTTVDIIVPKTDIEAYSTISGDNLTTKSVPPNIVDKNTVTSREQIVGQSTTAPLYAGKPIDLRTIVSAKEDLKNKQVVGVYIDAARCAGVTEGDIADVYRIPTIPGNPSPRIAVNSRVLKITDEKGTPVRGASSLAANGTSEVGVVKNPRIVYLLINPEEVPLVIQGSLDKSQSFLALSKKSKETYEPAPLVEEVE